MKKAVPQNNPRKLIRENKSSKDFFKNIKYVLEKI